MTLDEQPAPEDLQPARGSQPVADPVQDGDPLPGHTAFRRVRLDLPGYRPRWPLPETPCRQRGNANRGPNAARSGKKMRNPKNPEFFKVSDAPSLTKPKPAPLRSPFR